MTYQLELTEQEIAVIATALYERPFREVAALVAKIAGIVNPPAPTETPKAE